MTFHLRRLLGIQDSINSIVTSAEEINTILDKNDPLYHDSLNYNFNGYITSSSLDTSSFSGAASYTNESASEYSLGFALSIKGYKHFRKISEIIKIRFPKLLALEPLCSRKIAQPVLIEHPLTNKKFFEDIEIAPVDFYDDSKHCDNFPFKINALEMSNSDAHPDPLEVMIILQNIAIASGILNTFRKGSFFANSISSMCKEQIEQEKSQSNEKVNIALLHEDEFNFSSSRESDVKSIEEELKLILEIAKELKGSYRV